MAEQTFLQKYGKVISIVLVLVVFSVMVWYLFFKDENKTSTGTGTSTAKYKPSAKALELRNWSEKGWQEPNGNGAWWATALVGDKKWVADKFANNNPGWYETNERKLNGWFKGMDLNPNSTNEGYWRQAAPDIKTYLARNDVKDFGDIQIGEFLPTNS